LQPAEAKFLFNFFLPQLKSEQAISKKILCAVPPDQSDYKPHPKCMSALKLSLHLATTEMWFLDAVINHVFSEDDFPKVSGLNAGADVARWYDENFAQRLPRLEALSGEHLAAPVNFLGLLKDPAVAYLSFAIRHSVHHRGYLAAYLRPLGAKVPAIYVESADEPYPPSTPSVPVNM
jgi:uncharacterized damage-inducible protein DinB